MIKDDNEMDNYSRVPLLIKSFCKGIQIANATGFIYKYNNDYYLVTNWHVFSGRDAITKKPLHKLSALPDEIRINPSINGENKNGKFTTRISVSINLIDDDK